MKPVIFFDTETTGLPLFNDPSEDPRQPHLVQLAACLVDLDTRKTLSSIDLTIRPDGWSIPDEVAAIHGITDEVAASYGVAEEEALSVFMALHAHAHERIGHNVSFDDRILRIALKRYSGDEEADAFKAGKTRCTQILSTPILKLPPTAKMKAAGRNHHKSANLGEAFKHFTGRDIENAHSAMADVKACMTVFFAIQDFEAQRAAA